MWKALARGASLSANIAESQQQSLDNASGLKVRCRLIGAVAVLSNA